MMRVKGGDTGDAVDLAASIPMLMVGRGTGADAMSLRHVF